MPFYNVVFMGAEKTGKTSIIKTLIEEEKEIVESDYIPTVEDVYIKSFNEVNAKGKPISLHLWDTSGDLFTNDKSGERNRYYEVICYYFTITIFY